MATLGVLVEQVRDHCAARLARFKHPSIVNVVDELPHDLLGDARLLPGRSSFEVLVPEEVDPVEVAPSSASVKSSSAHMVFSTTSGCGSVSG